MPKPKLPRKPRPLRLRGIDVMLAEVVSYDRGMVPHVWINKHDMPSRPGLKEVARIAAWFAEAHAYIAAVEERRTSRG